MLSAAELQEILHSIPSGFKDPENDFFAPANRALLQQYEKLGVISQPVDDAEADEQDHKVAQPPHNSGAQSNQIYCNAPGCHLIFENVGSYQTHFNSLHRYLCAECKRSQPTAHLLDLHVSEQHDSYFAARLERGESMYACFLEECKLKFFTPEARKDHCITQHKFPGNFRFDQVSAKGSSGKKVKDKVHHKTAKGTEDETMGAMASNQQRMDTSDNSEEASCRLKNISFGHQKEKTFYTKKPTKYNKHNNLNAALPMEEPLQDLHELEDALDNVV